MDFFLTDLNFMTDIQLEIECSFTNIYDNHILNGVIFTLISVDLTTHYLLIQLILLYVPRYLALKIVGFRIPCEKNTSGK